MKRIILSLLFNVCVICPAFCIVSDAVLKPIIQSCADLVAQASPMSTCNSDSCKSYTYLDSCTLTSERNGNYTITESCLEVSCLGKVDSYDCDVNCVEVKSFCECGFNAYGICSFSGNDYSGCYACPANATCNGGPDFYCHEGYKKNALGNGCESETVTQCPEGQYLHTYNGVTACAPCPGNATCVNNELTCYAGYYKYTGQQSPYSAYFCCLNNATCDDTGNFLYCNAGYYGDATNGCKTCPDNATECDSTGAATKCEHSYLLYNGKCMWCPTAATCNGGDTMTCEDGYICEINDDDNVVECYNCPDGADCVGCKFKSCKSGYYGSNETNCKRCPANATCDKTTFKCNDKYYINETGTGCEPCGDSRVCTDGICTSCADNYYGNCKDGCFKCPSLDGRAGKSNVDGTPPNISIESCYVTVKNEVSDLTGRLNDDIGTYYFEEEKCYATDINK